MKTEKHPYELLIRWDQSGALVGAHVQHRYVIAGDDGTVIGETVSGAEPLTVDTAAGMPLGDLLTQAQADALIAKAAADAERDAALAAKVTAVAERDAALSQAADLASRLAEMEARLASLRPAAE